MTGRRWRNFLRECVIRVLRCRHQVPQQHEHPRRSSVYRRQLSPSVHQLHLHIQPRQAHRRGRLGGETLFWTRTCTRTPHLYHQQSPPVCFVRLQGDSARIGLKRGTFIDNTADKAGGAIASLGTSAAILSNSFLQVGPVSFPC